MTINPEISIGDILTIVSIGITIIALLISWRKDQELRRKEYADKIRRSASTIVAKLQRWKDLTLRLFEDIQPLITEADVNLVEKRDVIRIRDTFWRGMVEARAKSSQRILDEQIEIAYVDLYGYDPRIQIQFNEVVGRLRVIDQGIYYQALYVTQNNILEFASETPPYTSAQLGNNLRNTCYLLSEECGKLMDESIGPFSQEMIRLIKQSDQKILSRNLDLSTIDSLYTDGLDELRTKIDQRITEILLKLTVDDSKLQPRLKNSLRVPFGLQRTYAIVMDDLHHDNLLQGIKKLETSELVITPRQYEQRISEEALRLSELKKIANHATTEAKKLLDNKQVEHHGDSLNKGRSKQRKRRK